MPLGKITLIDEPFKRVALDVIGPLPMTEDSHRYVLTLVDYATRYTQAVATKEITVEAVANALVSIYSRLGGPTDILTDQGRQFICECMKEVNKLLHIKHLVTTPYHPMCNGLVEDFNHTPMKQMLRRMCGEN